MYSYSIYSAKEIYMIIFNTLFYNLFFMQDNNTDVKYTLLLSDYLFVTIIDLFLSHCMYNTIDIDLEV